MFLPFAPAGLALPSMAPPFYPFASFQPVTASFFTSTNGPSVATPFSGSYMAGLNWQTSMQAPWLLGYRWWCCNSGQATTPVKCALWSTTGSSSGVLVPGSVVTSGTLTAGQWNTVLLPGGAVPISTGGAYLAAIGMTATGFPDTTNQFGAGNPFSAGLSVPPLFAYGDSTRLGTNAGYGVPQGAFSTSSADPSVVMPVTGNLSDNLWVDVIVTNVPNPAYAGTFRLFPNRFGASPTTVPDNATPFTLTNQIQYSRSVTSSFLWFFSITGAASLPTWAGIYPTTGTPGVTAPIAQNTTPSWLLPGGGAASAGAGWVKCALATTLPAGAYRPGVYNSAGAGGSWSSRDYGYYLTGPGAAGLSGFGPVSAPANTAAASAYVFTGNPGAVPPYAQGTIEPANGTFALDNSLVTGSPQFPYLCADYRIDVGTPAGAVAESFWVDLEVQ